MPDLLLEIGTEEIPARMIDGAREELSKRVVELLKRERLGGGAAVSFSTPRRLAVLVREVGAAQPDAEQTVNGPAVKVAFKNGAATAAGEAFAKRVGQRVSELKTITTAKGEYLTATVVERGRGAAAVLAEGLGKEIGGLYWAKSMYWRAGKPERFVRPPHWIVALLDGEIIRFEFAGIGSGNRSRGHRVLGSGEMVIAAAAEYEELLRQGSVVADPAERRKLIAAGLKGLAESKQLRVREDAGLLDTVVNLTEFPSVVLGGFEEEYLALPEEVLVTVMRDHQKYFALEEADGRLAAHFLAVLNTSASEVVVHGNERVLRARFNDARFFWNTDQKLRLEDRRGLLRSVTFQKDLGSYAEKAERMARLVDWLVERASASGARIDAAAAITAAQLAKCDLTTELVKEFTELQGTIGGLYARAQGHAENVWTAIYDQYKPASMEAEVPRNLEGALVAIADKADAIAGMFALGLIPSGSKDPFALRRAANGVVKILAEHRLSVPIPELMQMAFRAFDGSDAIERFKNTDYSGSVALFFRERIEHYLRDVLGIEYDVVNAVLAAGFDDIPDVILRARAVAEVRSSPDFAAIAVSFKRVKNILRQALEKGFAVAEQMHGGALVEAQEQRLAREVEAIAGVVRRAGEQRAYAEAVREIARLRPALDDFFEKVMVMVEDEELRANRLALLARMLAEFTTIADFSEIVAGDR